MKSFKLESKKERVSRSKNNIFSWKIHPEDLKNQIDNYHNLGFFQSYREKVSIVPIWLAVSTILSVTSGLLSLSQAIPFIVLLGLLWFFVLKGSRWSIVLLMIIFTLEMILKEIEGLQVLNKFRLFPIVLWFLIMPVLFKALKIESKRKKKDKKDEVKKYE